MTVCAKGDRHFATSANGEDANAISRCCGVPIGRPPNLSIQPRYDREKRSRSSTSGGASTESSVKPPAAAVGGGFDARRKQ